MIGGRALVLGRADTAKADRQQARMLERMERRHTGQSHEEIRDIEHVRGIARGEMVHIVRLAALIAHDIKKDVHCRLGIVGSWAI